MAPRQRSVSSPTPSEESFPDSSSDSSLSSQSQERKLLNSPSRNASSPPSTTTTTTAIAATSTLIRTEADIARDRHDYFNVFALGFIIYTIFLNYDFKSFSFSYTGEYFWTLWVSTAIYFMVDLLWVTIAPICVKSPHVIVKHHIAAVLYLVAPVYYPQYRWFMGGILSVEVNTWFLIVRRLVYFRNNYVTSKGTRLYPPVSPWVCSTVTALFYTTWIVIRCYIYPRFLFIFWVLWVEAVEQTGVYFHTEMIFIPVHTALCALNLKWTYDLFQPIVTRWLGVGPKSGVVQSGL